MSKFVTGKKPVDAVDTIIWDAEEVLFIVSPFIKPDDHFKKLFDNHIHKPKLHIIIVFGKNETNVRRSLSTQDLEFFQKFLHVSIVYVPNLHAKYYGNERKGIITSVNLYDFSFKSNIESGVYSEHAVITKFINTTDSNAFETVMEIAYTNEAVFIKRPVYEKGKLSIITGKRYVKSDILYDTTKRFYELSGRPGVIKRITDFEDQIILNAHSNDRPEEKILKHQHPAIA